MEKNVSVYLKLGQELARGDSFISSAEDNSGDDKSSLRVYEPRPPQRKPVLCKLLLSGAGQRWRRWEMLVSRRGDGIGVSPWP